MAGKEAMLMSCSRRPRHRFRFAAQASFLKCGYSHVRAESVWRRAVFSTICGDICIPTVHGFGARCCSSGCRFLSTVNLLKGKPVQYVVLPHTIQEDLAGAEA